MKERGDGLQTQRISLVETENIMEQINNERLSSNMKKKSHQKIDIGNPKI